MTPEEQRTAYALDELDEALELSPAERAEVAEIQALATALHEELGADPPERLTADQRETIEAAATLPRARELLPHALAAVAGAAALTLLLPAVSVLGMAAPVEAPERPMVFSYAETPAPPPPPVPSAGEPEQKTSGVSLPVANKRRSTRARGLPPATAGRRNGTKMSYAAPVSSVVRRGARRGPTPATDGQGRSPTSELSFGAVPSTFSIDVDTAAYANVRARLHAGELPRPGTVRLEELINYFDYDDPPPERGPFAVQIGFGDCPWAPGDRLVRIGIKGRVVEQSERPTANLVFLVDVSGSMSSAEKLPLLRHSLRRLLDQLDDDDRVAIVGYAGAAAEVLPSTPISNKAEIITAVVGLQAGGGTNGGAGIERAYALAAENFVDGGVNRVILATDGDFNVGITDRHALSSLIQRKASAGIELSVLGFGAGSAGDATMEALSNDGNGNYAFIDSATEAERVLVEQVGGTLVTIAKDVKVQTLFNAARVEHYRLIGYDNRRLATRDFDDDNKDAGEIGAGHTVTALYQFRPKTNVDATARPHTLQLKLRHKQPGTRRSVLSVHDATDDGSSADENLQWARAVAMFGMLLRGDDVGRLSWDAIRNAAVVAQGDDARGARQEFLDLVERARRLHEQRTTHEPTPSVVDTEPLEPAPTPPTMSRAVAPREPGLPRFVLLWWMVAVGFSLVVGPLAWLKGARIRARYRHLGVPPAALPTATQILGFGTTLIASIVALLLAFS